MQRPHYQRVPSIEEKLPGVPSLDVESGPLREKRAVAGMQLEV